MKSFEPTNQNSTKKYPQFLRQRLSKRIYKTFLDLSSYLNAISYHMGYINTLPMINKFQSAFLSTKTSNFQNNLNVRWWFCLIFTLIHVRLCLLVLGSPAEVMQRKKATSHIFSIYF